MSKPYREWVITSLENNDDGPDVLIIGPNAHSVHVIEASALDAANKRIAELEAALKNISAISYGTESLWEDAEWLEWYSKEVGRLKDIAKSALNTKSGSKT